MVGRRVIEPRSNLARDLELVPGAGRARSQVYRPATDHLSHLRAPVDDGVDEQIRQPRRRRRTPHVDAERRLVDLVPVEIGREPELASAGVIHRRICLPSTHTSTVQQ